MKALASRVEDHEPSTSSLEERLDHLLNEIGDVKRILVLLQHKAVIASIIHEEERRQSWAQRLLGLFRGTPAAA